MNLYLLAAFLSGLFYAFGGVIYKLSNKHLIKDPLRYLLWYNVLRVLWLAPLVFVVKIPSGPGDWLIIVFHSISFFLGTLLTGISLVYLDASVFMPLFNLQIVFTPLLAFFLLGERFPLTTYLLMGLVLSGGILVTFSEQSRKRRAVLDFIFRKFLGRSVIWPAVNAEESSKSRLLVFFVFVLGLVFYSVTDNLAGLALRQVSVLDLVFFGGVLQLLFSSFLVPFISTREDVNVSRLWPIGLGVIFGILGLISINIGFSYSVSLSQTLSKLSSVYTLIIVVVLARLKGDFLEKHSDYVYLVRSLGSLVMVAAAISLMLLK